MKSIKKGLVTAVAAGALMLPVFASALTVDDIKAQIQTLLGQIQSLQQQMVQMRTASSTNGGATTTPPFMRGEKNGWQKPCINLTRQLGPGSRGNDVSQMQRELAKDKDVYPEGVINGEYGTSTINAIHRLQARFGIMGKMGTTTGGVGPQTMKMMHEGCGVKQDGDDNEKDKKATSTRSMMGTSTLPWMPWNNGGGDGRSNER